MPQPKIKGLEVLGLVGEGSCGTVYVARNTSKSKPLIPKIEWYAVRVFNSLAVNRSLVENMVKRLARVQQPKGLVPVVWSQSEQGNRCMVMPLYADIHENKATIKTRSLDDRLNDYASKDSWLIIDQIATALAGMHQNHLPHGNLKPGNIFFDENNQIVLTDYAMGHMPGVGVSPFTDALLYAAPEQIHDPEGYTEGKGYGWDTYAFAVMAFHILTGKLPRCEASLSKVASETDDSHITGVQADVVKLAELHEHRELNNWPEESTDEQEQKKRRVIQRCLSLNPKDRYKDVTEIIHAWKTIENDARETHEKAKLHKKIILTKIGMFTALAFAAAGGIGCLILKDKLNAEKSRRTNDIEAREQTITELKTERNNAKTAQITAKAAQAKAENSEANLRGQLMALGVTNDRILAWIMRSRNTDLPELKTITTDAEVLEVELSNFLEQTEGEDQFQQLRARIAMQLAELAIHQQKTVAANELLVKSLAAWKSTGIEESGFNYRIARARLITLIQSLDQKNNNLSDTLLQDTRAAVRDLKNADPTEISRINSLMQVIEGRLIQNSNPAKALEHFQLAIKELNAIGKAIPDNVTVRSDLARYNLQSSTIADSLDLVEDATRLRGTAATHLKWLLEKNPSLKPAKVKLAALEIMAAELDMQEGNDREGAKKLTAAEILLKGLPEDDTAPDGASIQIAAAKGLRAVIMRDLGRTTEAAKTLDKAVSITERIVKANPKSSEPMYRLAVFKWKRAGLAGDNGNTDTELKLGSEAADLMQRLLNQGAGKRDTKIRRSLAYLYGDLGHTAADKGQKKQSAQYFNSASKMWQSLIQKIGRKSEFIEGLKWSQQRYKEASS
jgi:serine/threonine protein kinase